MLLKTDTDFTPCPVAVGDELYANGIFVFNITKLIEHVQSNPDSYVLEEVAADDFFKANSSIDESHVDSADVSKPVILAEIAPGKFNLIDGNHRMEKARRMGITSIRAYKLSIAQHVRFLTSYEAYTRYVEYVNSKAKEAGTKQLLTSK